MKKKNLFTIENIYESKRTNIPPATQHNKKEKNEKKAFTIYVNFLKI